MSQGFGLIVKDMCSNLTDMFRVWSDSVGHVYSVTNMFQGFGLILKDR